MRWLTGGDSGYAKGRAAILAAAIYLMFHCIKLNCVNTTSFFWGSSGNTTNFFGGSDFNTTANCVSMVLSSTATAEQHRGHYNSSK